MKSKTLILSAIGGLLTLIMFQNFTLIPNTETDYFRFTTSPETWTGTPLDFSYLNNWSDNGVTTSSLRDLVTVSGSQFVTVNEGRSTPVKFFGVNLALSANFVSAVDAVKLADSLKNMGVNIVRIHKIDHYFADDPEFGEANFGRRVYPGIINTDGTLNYSSVTRLKNLISLFKQRGIYVDLNLHVGSKIESRAMVDINSNPFHIIGYESRDLQKDYACRLVQALGLVNNPALAMIEINNESSLVDAWQGGLLDHIGPGGSYYPELATSQGLVTGSGVKCAQGLKPKFYSDNPDEMGTPDQRRCYVQHLVNLDKEYLDQMKAHVKLCARTTSKPAVPITGTQFSMGLLANRFSHVNMDFLDTHVYIDHPSTFNYRAKFENYSMVESSFYQIASVALYRDANKPFTISEFNQSWPNEYGHEASLNLAAFGAVQDWNALMQFNYMNNDEFDDIYPRGVTKNSVSQTAAGFNLHGDPARLVGYAQAAKLFRTANLTNVPNVTMSYKVDDGLNFSHWRDANNKPLMQWSMSSDTKNRFTSLSNLSAVSYSLMLLNSRLSSNFAATNIVTNQSVMNPQNNIAFTVSVSGASNAKPGISVNMSDTTAINCIPGATGTVQYANGTSSSYKYCGSDKLELRYPFDAAPKLSTAIATKLNSSEYLLTIPGASYRVLKRKAGVTGFVTSATATTRFLETLKLQNDGKYKLVNPDDNGKILNAGAWQYEYPSWDGNKYDLDGVVIKRPKVAVVLKINGLVKDQPITAYLLNGSGQRLCHIVGLAGQYEYLHLNLASMNRRISPWYHIVLSAPASDSIACDSMNITDYTVSFYK